MADLQLWNVSVTHPNEVEHRRRLADLGNRLAKGHGFPTRYGRVSITPALAAVEGTAYDQGAFLDRAPLSGENMLGFVAVRAFAMDVAAGQASADISASALTVFNIQKNGANIGHATFPANATTAVFSFTGTATVSFAIQDRVDIIAPGTPDGAISKMKFSLKGTKI